MDPYVSCPYNPQHRVPKSRLQRHIIKCEQIYPPLAICPYNATHRHPESMIKDHVANCPSREQELLEDKPANTNAHLTTPLPYSVNVNDPDDEYWD